ncbi:MAG TPA: NAD-binding protein [Gemmatales bacterium]|nr:NAD-binding protein [Gemmatales bacterium]
MPEGPVILCGLGRIGWPVLGYLKALGWNVIAIDQECSPDDPRLQGVELIRGNFRDPGVLQKAGIDQTRGVILSANDDLANLAATLEIRRLNAQVRIIVRLFNENLVAKLGQTVANVKALSSSRLAGPLLASTALSGEVLSRFNSLNDEWQIERITIEKESTLAGRTITDLGKEYPSLQCLSKIVPGKKLQGGETLQFVGRVDEMPRLREAASGEESLTAQWAGRMRRFLRTVLTTLKEVEWPVKVAALSFFSVVLIGTMIHWVYGLSKCTTITRSLIHTLNIMVTSGNLDEGEDDVPWKHVFISFLKMSGLLLTAAFTALLTNYLVRVRLLGVLAISRVPESGHVVLCGLGTVGIRVVEALRRDGVPVVVLEKVETGRFLATARQLGATVLLGDATVPAILIRAHTAQARSLIAATSSDLANIEIALLAREQNPKVRVVLRLDDSALADALRQTANIRYALSLAQLTAPAFVLPLFGDRILSLFWIEQCLHLVVEIIVTAETRGILGMRDAEIEKYLDCWVIIPDQHQPLAVSDEVKDGQRILIILPAERIKVILERCYRLYTVISTPRT